MQTTITKAQLSLGLILLTLVPLFSGGKDALGQIVGYLLIMLALFLVWRMPQKRQLGRGVLPLAGAAFIGWTALSLIWSVNRYQTVSQLIVWLGAAGVFAVCYALRDQPGAVAWFKRLYVGLAVVMSLWGLYLFVTAPYERVTSSFYWANPFAGWLLPAVVIALGGFMEDLKKTAAAASVILLSAFILTSSRGALLALLPALVIAIWLAQRKLAWLARLVVVVLVAILLSFGVNSVRHRVQRHAASANQATRFSQAAHGEATSLTDRGYYLLGAFDIWRQSPLIGRGAGTYSSTYPAVQRRVISASASAHNLYAQTAAELGDVGALLLIMIGICGLTMIRREVRNGVETWAMALGLLALLIHLGLDIDASYPVIMFLAAALLGFSYSPRDATISAKAYYPVVILAAGLVLALPVADLYKSSVEADRGERLQASFDFAGAASEFGNAHEGVAYNPDVISAEGINYLVLARLGSDRKSNLALARDRAVTAHRLDPDDGQQELLLGRVAVASGDAKGAETAFRRAIRLDPLNHPEYHNDLAELLLGAKPTDSRAELDFVISHYSNDVLANRHLDSSLKPEVARSYALRAQLFATAGKTFEARQDAQNALRLQPGNQQATAILKQL